MSALCSTHVIRVLVVDDEPSGRRKVIRFLREHSDVEVIGESATGEQALEQIAAHRPDAVFLDVQMPGIDGFDVVEALMTGEHIPAIIFATAHDEYALRAFEVNALDYLLKPFDRDRFNEALSRVRKTLFSQVDTSAAQAQLIALLDAMRPGGRYLRRLLVPNEHRAIFVNVSEIVRIEADRNNVLIFTRAGSFNIRSTLESLEARLDPNQFARIHRSHIVNLDAIKEMHPWFHGDYKATLYDGTELMWSRRYAARRPDALL
jgi:two-component system, LytTR family, response regulator